MRENWTIHILAAHCGKCLQMYTSVSLLLPQCSSRDSENRARTLPTARPLAPVVIDILVRLLSIYNGDQNVGTITNLLSEISLAIPTAKINSTKIATMFLKTGVMPYGMPSYLLTDTGLRIVISMFKAGFLCLTVQWLTAKDYQAKRNEQVEQCGCTY